MNLKNIKMDNSGLGNVVLWGCGSLKVLIDSLYSKAEDIDNNPKDKSIVDEIYAIASMLETQTEAIKSKLQELDEQYIKPLEKKIHEEVTA